MAMLFRYELKKLLTGKLVWLLFALCFAFLFYLNRETLAEGWNGKAQGYRDIYRLYEGRVVTDSFKKEVDLDFIEYASAHPDQFDADENPEDGSVSYWPNGRGYYDGVWRAYQDIMGSDSVESRRDRLEHARQRLEAGTFEDGRPLTDSHRRYDAEVVMAGAPTPVVHYAQGWRNLPVTDNPAPAAFTFFVLGIALLPLFGGERSAKMEGVLLCSPGRGKAAAAKMLAAFVVACTVAVIFFGMDIAFTAGSYGFDGASLTLAEINEHEYGVAAGLPAGCAYGLYGLAVILITASIAALVALASAHFRHPLTTLLAVGVLIVAQILPSFIIFGGDPDWWMHMRVLPGFMSYNGAPGWWMQLPFWQAMNGLAARLPAILLTNRYMAVSSASTLPYAPFVFGLPALVSGLLFVLVPRIFLKRRKE